MRRKLYYCIDCIEKIAGKSVSDIPAIEFQKIRDSHLFEIGDEMVCPICGSKNIKQMLGMVASYVRGYGFLDKSGVKRDMDMHLMAKDQDPYKQHRKHGEKEDVMLKLQKAREYDKKIKKIHL